MGACSTLIERRTRIGTLVLPDRLVLVEDEPSIAQLIRSVLSTNGVQVLAAENGASALRLFEEMEQMATVALIDVNLPGVLDGKELARRIASKYPQIQVILMSGYSSSEANLENSMFLQKPFTLRELLQIISEAEFRNRQHLTPNGRPSLATNSRLFNGSSQMFPILQISATV
jgi:DNA-binding response OmpR family regulator